MKSIELLHTTQVLTWLGISRTTLIRRIAEGQFPKPDIIFTSKKRCWRKETVEKCSPQPLRPEDIIPTKEPIYQNIEPLLTIKEILYHLHIDRMTLRRWMSDGYFPEPDYRITSPRWEPKTVKAFLQKRIDETKRLHQESSTVDTI